MDTCIQPRISLQSGLTLIELITTLIVTAILFAVGTPAMQKLMANNEMNASVNVVMSHLQLARSEAIKRGVRAVLCPSPDGEFCIGSTEWQLGFILFADDNANRKRDRDEEILRVYRPDDEEPQIIISSTKGRKWIRYQSTGEAPGSTVTLTLCDERDSVDPRAVIVSNTGRPRISRTRAGGGPLEC